MPEGPEIWRVADRLSDALTNKPVDELFFAFDELKPYETELQGLEIDTVEARGKAILTRFSNDLNIYSHNQLYGKWRIVKRGETPDTNRSLRISITNDKHTAILYSASEIEVLTDDELKEHSYLEKLGPDLLHPDTDLEIVQERFFDDNFKNRKVATLLLDQGFLSGVGNYLRAEIMFVAGVHPDLKLRECTENQKKEMAEAAITLAQRSYETGGITTDPKTVEALKREKSSRSNYRHYAYGREGSYCHKCGDEIQVSKTGGRKLYFCPSCQAKLNDQ